MTSNRQSNIECLRVFSMYLIIVGHVIGNAKLMKAPAIMQLTGGGNILNFSTLEFLWIICHIAVNCYVMITGYFLINKNEFRWKGFIGVWLQTLFYSVVIFTTVSLLTGEDISWKAMSKSLTPLYHNNWWFITTYLCLLLVAPFLSIMAKSLSKRQFLILLAILFIFVFEYPYGKLISMDSPIVNFSFLFLLAGYIKINGLPQILKRHPWLSIVTITLIMFVPAMAYNVYRLKCGQSLMLLASDRTFIALFLSFAVFGIFCSKTMDGKISSLICRIAPYTLGVYLIHCHPSLQQFIWIYTIPDSWASPQWLTCPINILLSAAVIFIICVVIDIVRKWLFDLARIPDFIDWVANKLPRLNR